MLGPYIFGAPHRETTEFALSGTTVYLSRAERSRVETMVTSVGANDENGNIAILMSMFAV
jgi:magnesium-transporting ATPase (P-type)